MEDVTGHMTLDRSNLNKTDEEILDLLSKGRCTPRYLAKETDRQQPYISQRLKRLIEHDHLKRVDRGLYELVEDPRKGSSPPPSAPETREPARTITDEGGQDDEPDQSSDQATETATDDSDDFLDADDAITEAVRRVAGSWEDGPQRLDARKQAAVAVLEHAVETGNAVGKQDALEGFYGDYPVEGQNEETWWRKNVRPVLKEYGNYSQGAHGYIVDEEAVQGSDFND